MAASSSTGMGGGGAAEDLLGELYDSADDDDYQPDADDAEDPEDVAGAQQPHQPHQHSTHTSLTSILHSSIQYTLCLGLSGSPCTRCSHAFSRCFSNPAACTRPMCQS
jgi:hypothetical protein